MKLIFAILVTVMLFITNTVTAQNNIITATVVNITSDTGKVAFALYDKTNFRMKPLQSEKTKIVDGKSTVTFKDIDVGEYAIICFHDKNENHKMDFKTNGMPLEDYGASNNNMSFGPPKFEDAKFSVTDKNVSLEIKF
ncbi:DUF2141 domain-containing protein [Polaribacter sp. L3A8]|uniref:DUF2141 domain-containing protein n=1 Tax=Polaribacter sp. L3A8 TaxID=2686361 RepID=UPI00131D611A|nr:DUF2141 domain-containing protein [Polaribacter sp. L3A8]